jgi:hypothetical protein
VVPVARLWQERAHLRGPRAAQQEEERYLRPSWLRLTEPLTRDHFEGERFQQKVTSWQIGCLPSCYDWLQQLYL